MSKIDDTKELQNGIQKDNIINKLQNVVSHRSILLMVLIAVLLFQTIFIGLQCHQSNFYKRSAKMQYLSTYQVEQKIMKQDRKKESMRNTMKVALHYQPKMNERLLAEVAEMIYDTGECIYGIPSEELDILYSHEGEWLRDALSSAGAIGPGQPMPLIGEFVAKELGIPWEGVATLYNYKNNIRISMRWYFKLKSRYKLPHYYLLAYERGEDDMGQFCVVDSRGNFTKQKKITGNYRRYIDRYLNTQKRVEKIIGKKIIIHGFEKYK